MDDHGMKMLRLSGKGYVCSQIIIKMALELRGEDNPSLVRAMAGSGYGCGSGAGTCGALIGGCSLLALYSGKGSDEETGSERLTLMLCELSDWFAGWVGEKHGGIECETIVGPEGPASSMHICGGIVSETFEKAMEILALNNVDPTEA